MLSKLRQSKKEQGFTIIEVLIVLAIAGLILLVVFLAVPALQRNARNTQRTEDAGNILSAVTEFATNNNGSLPAAGATGGSGTALTIGTGASTNNIPVNLGYYQAADVSIVAWATGLTNTSTTDKAIIVRGAVCSTTTTGDPAVGSARSVVILYTLEPTSKQCRAS